MSILRKKLIMIAGLSLMGSWGSSGHAESWGGPHIGIFAGQAQSDNVMIDVDGFSGPGPGAPGAGQGGIAGARFAYDDDVAAYGVLAGYDWQSGDFVFGIEMDFTLADARSLGVVDPLEFDATAITDFDYAATLRGRVGWTTGPALFFGTAGFALGSYENELIDIDQDAGGRYTVIDADDSFADKNARIGLVVGGGIEFKVREHWSIRAEGHYMDFGTDTNFVNFANDSTNPRAVGSQQFDVENDLVIFRMVAAYSF